MDTKTSILIVDDDPKVRKTLSDILRLRGYAPTAAATGKAALDKVEEEAPAVALIDLKLEDISGLEVMGGIKECCPATECIVLTGHATQKSAIEAVNLGAYSYVQKPYDVEQLLVTVRRAVEKREAAEALRESEQQLKEAQALGKIGNWELDIESQTIRWSDQVFELYERDPALGPPTPEGEAAYYSPEQARALREYAQRAIETGEEFGYDLEVKLPSGRAAHFSASMRPIKDKSGRVARLFGTVQDITARKRAEGELQHALEKLRGALGGIIQTVALTVETKDPYTAGHQRRVADLARAIATEMGLSPEQIEGIRMTGLIHDLGKVGVPAGILSWPGQLNDLQFGLIKMHSQIGYDILKEIEFPWPMAQIVLQHHERMDGSGYPQGLSGEEILLEARVLAIADVVEAMSFRRPYRPARGTDKALEEIAQNRGVLYDAEMVDICLKLFTEKGFEYAS